jgi:hypothetical protein
MSHINFNWTSPTTRTDGSAIDSTITYNLYENGVKIVPNIGATNFSLLMDGKADGSYSYTVTAIDVSGRESAQSTPVQVNFYAPKSPAGLTFSLVA